MNVPVGRGWFVPYLQLEAGPSMARSVYRPGSGQDPIIERHWSVMGASAAGFQIRTRSRRFGIFLQADGAYTSALTNLYNERHASGGAGASLGLRGGL